MFKRLFQASSSESEIQPEEASGNPLADQPEPRRANSASITNGSGTATAPDPDSFDAVYDNAAVKPPSLSYGILKVAEMATSQHLAGMSPELKRNSILMALDAAGAEIDYLLEDAVFRQRALNDYEQTLQNRLREFENVKSVEVAKIQAELERLTEHHMARIHANLDEVAQEQDKFRGWQKRKQQECQRIADAALYCVPKSSQAAGDSFSTLLERGAAASWR